MKQTAVQWFALKVMHLKMNPKQAFEFIEWFDQAKEMEKEQIEEAYFSGIESTGEGWNGEYAEGNNPIIEEVFKKGFENWFEQFKNK